MHSLISDIAGAFRGSLDIEHFALQGLPEFEVDYLKSYVKVCL